MSYAQGRLTGSALTTSRITRSGLPARGPVSELSELGEHGTIQTRSDSARGCGGARNGARGSSSRAVRRGQSDGVGYHVGSRECDVANDATYRKRSVRGAPFLITTTTGGWISFS